MSLIELLNDKEIMVGAIDVATNRVETPEEVARVLKTALKHAEASRIYGCTNCGLAPLPREVAVGKLNALAAGAALLRKEMSGK
jgi:5-methyltetrahydropteroyltriglutamate--homocysteine methyltransferase